MHASVPPPLNCQKQSGNALFLILIAVALFAALAYAVTQSGRGGGNTNKEQATLAAAQIDGFFGDVQATITRLMLTGGCTDTQISFANNVYTKYNSGSGPNGLLFPADGAAGSNLNAPLDKHCDVFDPAGGGLTPQTFPNIAPDIPTYAIESGKGHVFFSADAFPGVGTSADEIVGAVSLVSQDVCRAYNKAHGVNLANGGDPPNGDWYTYPFDGTYHPVGDESYGFTLGLPTAQIPSGTTGMCFWEDGVCCVLLDVVLAR